MVRITGDELDWLVRELESMAGKRLLVSESLSRSRDIGKHDRHFATYTQFEIELESVRASISGSQLSLDGRGDSRYGISLESVARVGREGEVLEIVEWFESQTERRTRIRPLGQAAI